MNKKNYISDMDSLPLSDNLEERILVSLAENNESVKQPKFLRRLAPVAAVLLIAVCALGAFRIVRFQATKVTTSDNSAGFSYDQNRELSDTVVSKTLNFKVASVTVSDSAQALLSDGTEHDLQLLIYDKSETLISPETLVSEIEQLVSQGYTAGLAASDEGKLFICIRITKQELDSFAALPEYLCVFQPPEYKNYIFPTD